MSAAPTSYVCSLTPEQIRRFRELLEPKGWAFDSLPFAHWRARLGKTNIVAYESGKVTVQGRETEEVVRYILETEILKEARFGYEDVLAEAESPEMFEPHAGIDESGKGDYFGPLVVAAAYVDGPLAREFLGLGVADSKSIRSDRRITDIAGAVRNASRGKFSIVAIGPEAYNRLYESFGNVNRLLAWGHARALENLLEKVPDCPRAVSDQFGRKETVLRALKERGRTIVLEQRPKAESDVAVAAASILARAEFVRRMEMLGKEAGIALPKGAGAKVVAVATDLAADGGVARLRGLAKLHFKTTDRVLQDASGAGS